MTKPLNNHFESLYADMGGAIYWHSGGGMFASNLFKNNSAKYGGVFYHMKNGGYSIFNDSFIMNKAFYDGGVFYIRSNYSSDSISYSKFINNSAGRNGGIIYIGGDALKNCGIYNSIFVNNTAMNGGILYCKADISDNILSGNIFIKNIAKEKGNILFLNSAISKSYISDSIFVNNYEGSIMYNAKYTDRNSEGFSYTCYNCWWGNTLANYNETPPNTLGIKFLNWYYLDINSNSFLENGESGVLNICLNNVYDVGTKSIQHYCSLNSINFNIISQIGSISTNNVTLNKGIGNITYFSKGIKDNISIFYENFNFTKLINYKIPTLSVNTSDIIVGDVERIIVNTTDDVTGYINVTVLNETVVVYLINGSAEISLSNIPVGKYDVYVTYGGDDIFISEKINSTFEVGKFNLILSTNVNDSHVGQPAMFNITLFNNLNILPVGNITMKIDNNQYFIPITGNNIIYSLSDLSAKSYSVELNYEGDENFDSACEILKFNVYVNETIISKDMIKNYEEWSYYSAKFVDKYGNPLINENVIFKIENMSYSVQTNAYGIAILYENLSSNTYKIIAINNVTGENKTNYLIINKNTPYLEIQNPNQHYNNQNLFILSLKSSYGNPLENIMLNIELNNKKYNLTTNSNGQTKLLVNGLTPNCYAAIISFEGNSNYYPSFTRINITIEKAPSIISVAPLSTVYNENKYLLINLKDDMGNPISGIEVSIGIEGIKYLKTDKNGQIKFSTNKLPPKSYNARITFIGNANYVKSTVNVKVTVKKATPKITAKSITFKKSVKTKKYKITLKDNQNKLMKNIKVVLKLNKKTYTAKTNKKGVATFKITNLAKKGTFKSTVSYKGNKYYNKVTKKAIIKVK